LKTIKRVIL